MTSPEQVVHYPSNAMLLRAVRCSLSWVLVGATLAACAARKDDPAPVGTLSWSIGLTGLSYSVVPTISYQKDTRVLLHGVGDPTGSFRPELDIQFPAAVGTYTFGPYQSASGTIAIPLTGAVGTYQYYAGPSTGTGTITVDQLTATRVQGTFSFTGVNPGDGIKMDVVDGRFDAPLKQ